MYVVGFRGLCYARSSWLFVVQHSALCSVWRVTRDKGHLASADPMTVFLHAALKIRIVALLALDWPYFFNHHNFCSALRLMLYSCTHTQYLKGPLQMSTVCSLHWRGEQRRDEGWGCFCIPADLSSAHYHSTLESVHIFISSHPEICPPTHKIRMRKLPIFKL